MNCHKCLIDMVKHDEMNVCLKCGNFNFDLVNTYNDDNMVFFNNNNSIIYIRSNHFKETLYEIQGKQTKRLPSDIFNMIQNEFTPKNTVEKNILAMRGFLKKKRLNCYIKITNNILTNLKLINPPIITDVLFNILSLKFNDVEHRFNQMENNDRKNLLPNNYLIYRFFQELNFHQFISYVSLFKNKKLLDNYDSIYEKLI